MGRLVNGKLFWQFGADLSLGIRGQVGGERGTGQVGMTGQGQSGDNGTKRGGKQLRHNAGCFANVGLFCQWRAVLSMAGCFVNGGVFCLWQADLSMAD